MEDLQRLSTGIFKAGSHVIKYDRSTNYLTCNCARFAFDTKCEYAALAKIELEADGLSVKFRRAPKPAFLEEMGRFAESFKHALTH